MVDLSDTPAVDGHCHPLLPDPRAISPERLLDLFSEGRPGTMRAHVPHTGYFHRALEHLGRRLGTAATVEAILDRRRTGGGELGRRALAESRVSRLLVDTGYPPEAMALDTMRATLACGIHEVFRIERCAEALLARKLRFDRFLEAYRAELTAAAGRAVALKSIIAYRSGLAIRSWPVEQTAAAYRDTLEREVAAGSARLVEKPLLDTLLEVALEVCRATDRPLQLHAGFGDPDIDLLQSNPLLLRPVLEDPRWAGVRLVVLHLAYPYFREAAFMAAVWPQVFVDLSLAIPYLGPAVAPPLTEVLSLAPSSKLLYGSDLGGLPELLAMSADWARAALGESLGWLVDHDAMSTEEARRVGGQILSGNATELYGL